TVSDRLVERLVVLDALGREHRLVGGDRDRPADLARRKRDVGLAAPGDGERDRACPWQADATGRGTGARVDEVDVVADHAGRRAVEPAEVAPEQWRGRAGEVHVERPDDAM